MNDVLLVDIPLRDWNSHFWHRIDALSRRTGQPVATFGVREEWQVPRNLVLCYMDPAILGRVAVCCHPADREAVEAKMAGLHELRLSTIEVLDDRVAGQ